MGIKEFLGKIRDSIQKQVEKMKIDTQRSREIKIVKEKYLSKLSHKELVQIYKMYLEK